MADDDKTPAENDEITFDVSSPDNMSPNSWEWVRLERKRILSGDYPVLDALENLWAILDSHYNDGFDEPLITRNEDERISKNPLGAFLYYIDLGFIPPPEVLLSLFECFHRYYSLSGDVSLEEIFFGKPKSGVGNESARKARKSKMLQFQFELMMEEARSRNTGSKARSAVSVAEEFLAKYGQDDDPESFVRSYRRFLTGR